MFRSGQWRAALLIAVLAAPLGGCFSPRVINPDIPRTLPSANEAQAMQIMRRDSKALTQTPFVAGNQVDLLKNGPATYAAMLAAIAGAQTRIDMESYEFDGEVAAQFSAALIAKAGQGVPVHLIYDAWGTKAPAAFFDHLRHHGVQVVEYSPFDPTKLTSLDLNRRDHRKLLIIDGAVTFTGGINIAQVYENSRQPAAPAQAPSKLPWRDTDIRIAGPVTKIFETYFAEDWASQNGPALPPPPEPPGKIGDATVQALDGAPPDGHPAIYRSLLVAIAAARQSIHLTTGFFAPTPDLAAALEAAARRGVDVELIVPGTSNSDTTIEAGRSHYEDLLKAGVHLYERQNAVLHAKTAVIDGRWSVVGSANLDWRSVVYNNEIDAVVLGTGFGTQMEAMFAQDIAQSRQITPAEWSRRGIGERLDEMRARLVEFLL